MTRTFPNTGGPFSGLRAARAWCRENDHACGSQQRNAPIGVHHIGEDEEVYISKWRNMTKDEQRGLDGRLDSADYRDRAVVLVLTRGPLA